MKYLSVCSGIEAATVAWHPLGWEAAGYSEIEKFPSSVLKHHYPNVTNFGDMTKFKECNLDAINLLVGGTPCQSFSVAGLRKGLEDPRGNLALTYCGILDHFRPNWFVWENVPGVLSSGGGRDFGSFLGAVAEIGYGFAYRVLDAQYFGVAQRRRRVFVVGYFGDWRPAAEVLFEPESLRRDTPLSRSKRKETTRVAISSIGTDCYNGSITGDIATTLTTKSGGDQSGPSVMQPYEIGNTLTARMHKGMNSDCNEGQTPVLQPIPIDMRNAGRDPEKHDAMNRQGVGVGESGDPAHTVTSAFVHAVAQPIAFTTEQTPKASYDKTFTITKGSPTGGGHPQAVMQPTVMVAPTLTASNDPSRSPQSTEVTNQVSAIHAVSMAVRRLTLMECERLQGFPDNYTDIKLKGKDTPDGPRYKALGNSMAVPVMAWIGKRIQQVSEKL
jgi:DNA (cytosine-5)-methyltransferase 1